MNQWREWAGVGVVVAMTAMACGGEATSQSRLGEQGAGGAGGSGEGKPMLPGSGGAITSGWEGDVCSMGDAGVGHVAFGYIGSTEPTGPLYVDCGKQGNRRLCVLIGQRCPQLEDAPGFICVDGTMTAELGSIRAGDFYVRCDVATSGVECVELGGVCPSRAGDDAGTPWDAGPNAPADAGPDAR